MAGRPTKYLLPHGREGLTAGTYEQRLGALQTLGLRLTEQTAKPALVTLGTTVTTFYTQATAMRDFQGNRKAALDAGRVDLEAMRKLASGTLFAMVGTGMILWRTTPEMVDTLFDVNLLRNPAQTIPAPPADTAWDPATRARARASRGRSRAGRRSRPMAGGGDQIPLSQETLPDPFSRQLARAGYRRLAEVLKKILP